MTLEINIMINMLTVIILYAFVSLFVEFVHYKFSIPFLLSRKMTHIAGSVVSFTMPLLVSNIQAFFIVIAVTVFVFLSKKIRLFKSIHHEDGSSVGEVVYPLGIALSAILIWPISVLAFQGSCLVLGFSDGLAGYFGKKYGKRKYKLFGGEKTIEGSTVFFLSTLTIFISYQFIYGNSISVLGILLIALYSIIITSLEAILTGGWDNILIPIAAGLSILMFLP